MTPAHPNGNIRKGLPLLMLSFLAVCLLTLLMLLIVRYRINHTEIHVYDGFESPALSSQWSQGRMVPGSFRVQSNIVRAGHSAGEITVHSGDRHEDASDSGAASERDELMEEWWLFAQTDHTYRYSFSLYLPADFPIVPTRLVLAQWKQLCEWTRCRPDNPVLALRYQNGELLVTRQDEHARSILYSTKKEMRGRWLDFRFETRFSRGQDGQIDAWLNGEPIVHYQGPTVYQVQRGYPARGRVYFKTGLYRDEMQQPMTMYVDEYRKDELSR
ncbi:MAG: heparin lyase I family protein [Candidatus Sulfotelmatobacter sp.]